jgi:uncharacterized protein YceH (UPF0502 family)
VRRELEGFISTASAMQSTLEAAERRADAAEHAHKDCDGRLNALSREVTELRRQMST